jgi:protease-4
MFMSQNAFIPRSPESGAKKFWRIVFGSMTGFFLSMVVCFFLSVIFMLSIIVSLTPKTTAIKDSSILKITLSNQIVERAVPNPFEDMDMGPFSSNSTIGLDDILNCIEQAASDPKIKGIYLNISSVIAAPATIEEIRNALLQFKESGKFIFAYSDIYTQNAYYLATVADNIAMNVKGELSFKGLASQILFYKGLLEKLNVDIQVIKHGEFKSAVEPYTLDKMSEANRLQMSTLLTSIWENMLNNIEKTGRISKDSLNMIADHLFYANAQKAKDLGMIDLLCYYPDVEKELKTLAGTPENEKINFVSLNEYKKNIKDVYKTGDKIAVIYALGQIIDGKGTEDIIGSETLTREIQKAYRDNSVKAIVLRVNSPGGSALASEIIWNEIEMAKQAGKKVVVSMGDYAASGGYYISCGADVIIAQPSTLTGSIGVFGMIPSLQNFLKNKLGVTVDVVTTNKHSDFATGLRRLDEAEIGIFKMQIEDIYATFIQRVADGRDMTTEAVDKIGEGRVWSGKDAVKLGLADKLGGIEDAIVEAATLADLKDYSIDYYPVKKNWWSMLFDKDQNADAAIKAKLGEFYYIYAAYNQIVNANGVQARMPFDLVIE